LVHTASIAIRSAASGSAEVTVLVGVAVEVEGAAALLRVVLRVADVAAGELAGGVGVECPVEVTAGEDCGAREADAAGAADEVDVARGGGSCRCTPEELLEHPVSTALLNATTARMVTRTTRLMLSTPPTNTCTHIRASELRSPGTQRMPGRTDSGQPDQPVLAKEKHPNWNGTTTKTA